MFFRLLLFIPMMRQFMLLDTSAPDEGSETYDYESPYERLDHLAKLHARAMLHLNQLGWEPVGKLYRVSVGLKRVKRPWSWWRRYEVTYQEHFGVGCFGGFVVARSGAIYGQAVYMINGEVHIQEGQLDPALMDDLSRSTLVAGLEAILELTPVPIYVTD